MTTAGWITLIVSVGSVTLLAGWCLYRVLRGPGAKHEHELGHVEPVDRTHSDER